MHGFAFQSPWDTMVRLNCFFCWYTLQDCLETLNRVLMNCIRFHQYTEQTDSQHRFRQIVINSIVNRV
jgi:hypothetical protein